MNFERPSRELSIGEILSLSFKLYRSKFLQFFLPFLISGIIMGISIYAITSSFPLSTPPHIPTTPGAQLPYEELIEWFFALFSAIIMIIILSGLVSWIVGTMTVGVVIKNASDQIEKGTSNLGDSLNFAISKLPSLLVAQFIAGILIVIGMLLLIVPGIIIAIMFSLVIPVIVVEQKGAFESLGRSKKLVSNRWLKIFALLLVLIIILGMFGFTYYTIAYALAKPFSINYPIVNSLILNIMSAFVGPIFSIALTYLYYAMVARENPPPPLPPNP